MTADLDGLIARLKQLLRSEAFWFGVRETLTLRIVFDPEGHRRDFMEMLERHRIRAIMAARRLHALRATGGGE